VFYLFIFFHAANATHRAALKRTIRSERKPFNIIFFNIRDDVGYEVPTCDGGQTYKTPFLDNLLRKE